MPEARCRSCQIPVIWADTVTGKKMPLERQSDGNIAIIRSIAIVNPPDIDKHAIRYVSHFAVCPQAELHRKRKVRDRVEAARAEVRAHQANIDAKRALAEAQPSQLDLFE